ncbi:spore germination protein [Paenibacillus physcomitrellae]|uniref:Membrane protein YndD n=1 Tax=Paenibacillus physcomitrellae TaxID=1619311 RepID=A0ABQ1FYR3_9BACL|nr:spore germination protein [Paenibacillus physcomitrellae]GGA34062.1 putative membrane protein YndD [Paenibacillus physcomitrellae]
MSSIISHIPSWGIFAQALIALLVPICAVKMYKRMYSFIDSRRDAGAAAINQEKEAAASPSATPFSGDYAADAQTIHSRIGGNNDLTAREFTMTKLNAKATLYNAYGMQSDPLLNMRIMEFLMFEATMEDLSGSGKASSSQLPFTILTEAPDLDSFNRSVLYGYAGLLIEGLPRGLLIELPNGANRSISEPLSEALLRGPRLGFSEVLSENTSMLRRQGYTEQLEMKSFRIGTSLSKDLVVAYIKDIVNPDLLQEVMDRVQKINAEFLADSGYIEQLIEDNYLSPFQQVQNTERPDRVINALLEGRVAILLDGTPFALIVPATFSMLLQSPEDYYERWLSGSAIRMLRFVAAFMSLMAPALYISLIAFHPGLIPTELALTIIETRQGVPFPPLIEVLILEISIEILREAGIRLPKPIGPAMGIVGGLIIGDAAVQAGIVSPFLVIVVAVTAISSFSIPTYSAGITLRLLRFAGMLFAAVLGMFGTILFFLLLCSHLTKLKSFGVPYLTPASPFRLRDWKDLFFRVPLSLMKQRPAMFKTQKSKRKS